MPEQDKQKLKEYVRSLVIKIVFGRVQYKKGMKKF